ncbi:MAG: elongation factor G [Chloroflexi bacterium]|nr:elongation factor G [Chloroflexota bacterium]MDA1269887.1 elongation factor G [Chloroflexota bacterium]PKB59484.1 MAG: translation elongation factor G [SAR202 cluster bacterium Casp-Chloro-G2]
MADNFPIEKIRNIGFIAHIDAGKTTVTEQVLFATGRIHRAGGVDEGNTAMDWMPQEKERGITITAAATTTYWKEFRVNVIDTPGHVDFTAEVERSLRVLDGGIVVLDAVAGVQSQSETVWRQADTYKVPRICFVNKMDRAGASYERTIESIRRRLNGNPVAIQLPIGSEDSFAGMIDLITGKATIYPVGRVNEGNVDRPKEVDTPPEFAEQFEQYRQELIEKVAETDEVLLVKYLEGEEISEDELKAALRQATCDRKIVPVLLGSAMFAKGIHNLLDAIIDYLPSPADAPPVEGINPRTNEIELRHPDADEPLSALAFKVATDPYVGRLVFLRVYSGTVKAGAVVNNVTKNSRERMGRLLRMHANSREELDEVTAGNICAAIGLKDTFTGDTIGTQDRPVILEPPKFPKPVVSVAIEPTTKADQDRLTDSLRKLADEDPTFVVSVNDETGQTIISGMGELHLEVLVDRMRREFNVAAQVGMPRVSYRETLTSQRQVEGRFVRQTGGHGQFGHVILDLIPLERGEGIIFENNITRGAIPREFIPAVEKGVRDALDNGPLAGYPLVDLKVSLVDGSFHQVDSSEMAFRSAGMLAIREGAPKCAPVLLEPIADLEVVTPEEYLGEVIGDLGTRRAQIQSIEGQDNLQYVRALLPLGETFAYTTALRSISQGRASYSMEFKYYEPVPDHIVRTLVPA